MDKYMIYQDIHERMINAVKLGGTPEGALIIGIIGQACQDAMGLYGAERERVYSSEEVDAQGNRKWVSRRDEAIEWFKSKSHYPFADQVELESTWITHLLRTKAGVEI